MNKYLATIVLGLTILIFSGTKVQASEGLFQLDNQVGESARCFAASVLMPDQEYNILLSCRDILYPGGTQVFSYVVWTSDANGNVDKLGTVDSGKKSFDTDDAFFTIFVTKEETSDVRSPQGEIIMQGPVQQIDFLNDPNYKGSTTINELGEPELTPEPIMKTKKSPLNLFRIGGAIAAAVLAGMMLLVIFITRK